MHFGDVLSGVLLFKQDRLSILKIYRKFIENLQKILQAKSMPTYNKSNFCAVIV